MFNIKRFSIRTKIMFLFTMLIIVLFTSVGLLFFRSTQYAIREATENEFNTLSKETANKIERFLFERYGDIQVMAGASVLKSEVVSKEDKLLYLNDVREAYKTYDYIAILDYRGNISLLSGDIKKDNSYKEIFSYIKNGKIYVSDFKKVDNKYVIFFAAPILNNSGILTGAVVERMNFNALSDIIESVKPGPKGYAYFYDGNRDTIFYPGRENIKGSIKNQEKLITYNIHDNVNYLDVLSPISSYDTQNQKWFVVVEEPEREAFKVIYSIKKYTLTVILAAVLILLLMGLLMSNLITRPIKRLVKETQNIVQGNIGQNIVIDSRDEIGSLAMSFNDMLSNLKSMMQQVLETSGEAASFTEIREYVERFFDDIPGAIIAVDVTGKITTFNSTASVITGISNEAIEGENINRQIPVQISIITDLLKSSLEDGSVYIKHITKIKGLSGNDIPIIISISHQKDSGGRTIGVIAVFRRLEEIKKFEESVTRSKNLASLGMMSAGIAHELRNPLTSIKGYAQYIKSVIGENNELEEDISIIITEVDRLNGIIDRFLNFASPKKPELKVCDINSIINDVIKLISKDIKPDNIKLDIHLGCIPLLMVDNEQIEQAFINIIINSVQAMPDGGILGVSTKYNGISKFIELEIKDTGIGIEYEDIERVFEPFFTTKHKGTGLGLAICARIIEDHKGFIEVSSIPLKGTEFIIKLPVVQAAVKEEGDKQ